MEMTQKIEKQENKSEVFLKVKFVVCSSIQHNLVSLLPNLSLSSLSTFQTLLHHLILTYGSLKFEIYKRILLIT